MAGYKLGPDWCMTEPYNIGSDDKYPNKIPVVRCHKCGKRMQVKYVTIGHNEYAQMISAHKIRKTKRKK